MNLFECQILKILKNNSVINKYLISAALPQLHANDTAYTALQYMADFRVSHLPLVIDNTFEGLISEEALLDLPDEHIGLHALKRQLMHYAISIEDNVFDTLAKMTEFQLSTLPVIGENKQFFGSICREDLLKELAIITGAFEKGALIVLAMDKKDYALTQLSRLVESNDAYITQLYTFFQTKTGEFLVAIKINKFEVSEILATFQRFEYNVKYYFGEERYENELRNNYDHLMNYLNI